MQKNILFRKKNVVSLKKIFRTQHLKGGKKMCTGSEGASRAGWERIRQNTAIYGYDPRTAEVLCTLHKGKATHPWQRGKWARGGGAEGNCGF